MAYFERFLSTRYLFTSERKALLTVITAISVCGVAVGVAALIIVLGVMDGAEKELFGKVIEIYPHVKVMDRDGAELERPEVVIAAARALPGVVQAEAVINKPGLFTAGLGPHAELVAGQILDLPNPAGGRLYPMTRGGSGGTLSLARNEIALGAPLAKKLAVKPGDEILVITGLLAKSPNRQQGGVRLRVATVFETGYYDFDSLTAFVSAETARESFGRGGAADYVELKLSDPFQAAEIGRRLQSELGLTYHVQTWIDEQGFFFQSLKIQKAALFLILMLIILVAGFNIIGTLILMVIDKTREIGILKAIGCSDRSIRRTFVGSGLLIGFLGTSLGVALGLTGCFLLKYVIKLQMPSSVYKFTTLPVVIKPLTVVIIILSSMIVCLIASFLPAAQAARLDPVEALRHD